VIEQEFRDGWSALAIYERHKDELSPTISYRHFLRYVAEWRPEKPKLERKAKVAAESTPPVREPAPPPARPPRRSFAVSVPKKET
jgi:hypothetical protein